MEGLGQSSPPRSLVATNGHPPPPTRSPQSPQVHLDRSGSGAPTLNDDALRHAMRPALPLYPLAQAYLSLLGPTLATPTATGSRRFPRAATHGHREVAVWETGNKLCLRQSIAVTCQRAQIPKQTAAHFPLPKFVDNLLFTWVSGHPRMHISIQQRTAPLIPSMPCLPAQHGASQPGRRGRDPPRLRLRIIRHATASSPDSQDWRRFGTMPGGRFHWLDLITSAMNSMLDGQPRPASRPPFNAGGRVVLSPTWARLRHLVSYRRHLPHMLAGGQHNFSSLEQAAMARVAAHKPAIAPAPTQLRHGLHT